MRAPERLKTIASFPCYVVSEDGRVFRGVRELKQRERRGYLVVDLYRSVTRWGKFGRKSYLELKEVREKKTVYVHRLVAEAFLQPMPADKPQVGHLDGNRHNNAVSNLQWVCQSENEEHKRAHGTKTAGEKHPRCKLTDEEVASIRQADGRWTSQALAKVFEVHPATIRRIRRGVSRKPQAQQNVKVAA
jgi:hypothetical protein